MAYGVDTLKHLRQTFVAANFNMRKLLTEIVTVSALRGFETTPLNTRKEKTETANLR